MAVGGFIFTLILLVVWFIVGKDVAEAWGSVCKNQAGGIVAVQFLLEFSKAMNNVYYR